MTVVFSSNSLHAINDFAARMGLPAMPAQDGTFNFRFERSGELMFIPSLDSSHLIISLQRTPQYQNSQRELRILQSAGPDLTTGLMLHAGMTTKGAIVFSFMLEDREIDIPKLERCVDRLIEVHNKLD